MLPHRAWPKLLRRGHAIDFVMQAASTDINPGPHAWRGRTVFVGPTPSKGFLSGFARHWLAFRHDLKSLRLAQPDHYDAIQFRDKFAAAAWACLVARARGLKFFFWLSFPYPESDLDRARDGTTRFPLFARLRGMISAWLLYRWILPRADHVFVQSERMRDDIARQGIPRSSMTPVPMGIDLADIADMPLVSPDNRRNAKDSITLGYLGVINADRHLEILIDTLVILRGEGYPVRLLMVGDAIAPADREALRTRAAAAQVADSLEITGFLPRADALQRMREADIAFSPFFPVPVFLSTSPTKLVECMALGIPIVASEHPEQRLILKASKAGLCAPWHARHFARAVRHLLRIGPTERVSMGRRGRQWIEQHRSYSSIADDLERKYRDLLAA